MGRIQVGRGQHVKLRRDRTEDTATDPGELFNAHSVVGPMPITGPAAATHPEHMGYGRLFMQ